MRRKLLVVGGGGFIGSYVVDLLKNSEFLDLIIWDRKKNGNFLDKNHRIHALNLVQPEIVLHLAWCEAGGTDSKFDAGHKVWSQATVQFIDEFLNENTWFINAGSSAEESSHNLKNSPYGKAKLQINDFLRNIKIDSITRLQIPYVFSLEANRPNILKNFIESKDSKPFQLLNPNKKIDFVAVEDVAAGIKAILENSIFGPVYLGSGKLRSVEQFIYCASKILDLQILSEGEFESSESVLQPNKLSSVGWIPVHTNNFFEYAL